MPWKVIIVMLVVFGFSSNLSAEYYMFKDENGVVRFTDNIVEVPVVQRSNVKRFAESDDHLSPEQLAEKERLKKERTTNTLTQKPLRLRQKEAADLNKKKEVLEETSKALLKERSELEKEEKIILKNDVSKYNEYREKVLDFNRRLSLHKEQLKLFNEKAEAFNKAAEK